jgi:hypothetical protein
MAWFNSGYDPIKEEAQRTNYADEFRLDENATANIRFLDEEPFSFRQHSFQVDGKWPKFTCRQGLDDQGCPLCKSGDQPRFVAAFTVYDRRDKKIKTYVQGIRVLKVLDKLHARSGGLTGQDIEVTRSGKGTDTTYNFIPCSPSEVPTEAKDQDGNVKHIDFSKIYAPKSYNELEGAATRLSQRPATGGQQQGNRESFQAGPGRVAF